MRFVVIVAILAAGPAFAQSASPINPSYSGTQGDALSNIRPFMYRPSESYRVQDRDGRTKGYVYSPSLPATGSWDYVPTTRARRGK